MAKTAESVEITQNRIRIKQILSETKPEQMYPHSNERSRTNTRYGRKCGPHTNTSGLPRRKNQNTGDHKPELQHRITATWATFRKLGLLWGKSTASIKWRIRVYDAVTVAKLMYGLASIPLTKADGRKIDAFEGTTKDTTYQKPLLVQSIQQETA